jgi:membrane-associated protein
MLELALEIWRSLTNPDRLINLLSTVFGGWWGYLLLSAIVFAETGLLLGFFLPGDSLLFTVGVVAGAGQLNIVAINVLLMAAAIVGDGVGYWLGKRTGPKIFNRPDSRLFKQEHLRRTEEFYKKHGGKTIIYARFVPIVRTFAPFVAGVAGMGYLRFLAFNVFGGIGWVLLLTLLGYTLGSHPLVRAHFEKVVLGIIFVSVLPIALEMIKSRRRAS